MDFKPTKNLSFMIKTDGEIIPTMPDDEEGRNFIQKILEMLPGENAISTCPDLEGHELSFACPM